MYAQDAMNKAARTVTVANRAGWHIRPASLVAKMAGQFQARIELVKGDLRANARNMLEMLGLAASQGEQIVLEATGTDAEAALDALVQLFADGFNEDDGDD